MNNHIIQGLWIGNEISLIEQLCIKSFLKHGHEFHLYVYDQEIKGCPSGTTLKDANEIIVNNLVYKDVLNTYTSFANWFRYKLLYEKGGWWVDMDVICLRNFDFKEEFCFTTEVMFDANSNGVVIVNNAIIKAPAHAEFLLDMLEDMAKRNLPKARWGEFGSRFLDSILKSYESEKFIQPPHVFCKINWHEVDLFFNKDPKISFDDSHAIHLWNNIWSKRGINKNSSFSPTSIIETLKAKYL